MADEDLPIPLEIPWQLASTTRPLEVTPQIPGDSTTISLFTYVPTVESLATDYPNERLIYLKFTVSVSPFVPPRTRDPILDLLFSIKFPIWGMLFDVRVLDHEGPVAGSIRPYFLAASPVERTMIESGVVGDHLFEGESNEVAFGKSASQLHEVFNSTTKISKGSAGIAAGGLLGPVLIGGGVSHSGSTTTIGGSRDVVETRDTTNREASVERRELFSHLTSVNNVLSLLKTHLVGTPYLRFLLRPLPLRQLSIDPSDPLLWYSEFIKRRSSGIEGMQDFYAIVVVPRDMEQFCIEATLTRAYIDEPPLPRNPDEVRIESFDQLNWGHWIQILDYLNRIYPPGTPVDELDVDIFETPRIPPLPVHWDPDALEQWHTEVDDILAPSNPFPVPPHPSGGTLYRDLAAWFKIVGEILAPGQIPPLPPLLDLGSDFMRLEPWRQDIEEILADVQRIPKTQGLPRPVIEVWSLAGVFVPMRVTLRILTQPPSTQQFTYKWASEVWLEWKRFEYEEELTRSPLLRGQPTLTVPLWLRTCFEFSPEGNLNTLSEPPNPIPIPNTISLVDLQPVEGGTGRPLKTDSQFAGRDAVFSWNALDTKLAAALANLENPKPMRMDDESVVKLFLRRAESLLPDSPINQTLDEVLQWVTLSAAQIKKLRELKIADLRTLAASLRIARVTAFQKFSLTADRPRRTQTQQPSEIPRLPESLLSTEDAALITRAIGKALQTRFEKTGVGAPPNYTSPTKRQRRKRTRS